MLIIIHHGIVDGWGKLRHLIDLTQIDKTLNAEQWKDLCHLTKKYKVYKAIMLGCYIAAHLFDYTFINQTDYTKVAKLSEKIIVQIKDGKLSGKWSQQPIELIYYIQMRDGLVDAVKSLVQFVHYAFIELRFKLRR